MKQALISFLLLLAFNVQAQIIQPNAEVSNDCGPKIKKSKVMVLDIESFGEDRESAEAFVREHAGDHRIVSATNEDILTSLAVFGTPTRKTAIKAARRQAAKRGCDLVIFFRAFSYPIGSTNTAFTDSISVSQARMRGIATVVMGDRS